MRGVNGAGNGENLPSLTTCPAGGGQGPAPGPGLHNEDPQGQSADDPVAPREISRPGRSAHGKFASDRAGLGHRPEQGGVLGGIHPVRPAAENTDGLAAGVQSPLVGGSVHAPGQAADDREAGSGQIVGEGPGVLQAAPRGAAAAHDGQSGAPVEGGGVTFRVEQGRGARDSGQGLGIALIG